MSRGGFELRIGLDCPSSQTIVKPIGHLAQGRRRVSSIILMDEIMRTIIDCRVNGNAFVLLDVDSDRSWPSLGWKMLRRYLTKRGKKQSEVLCLLLAEELVYVVVRSTARYCIVWQRAEVSVTWKI